LLTMVGTASAGSVAATRNTPTMEKRRVRRKGEAPQPRMIVTYFPPSEGSVFRRRQEPSRSGPEQKGFLSDVVILQRLTTGGNVTTLVTEQGW
jgi:hypothetical protein